MTLWKYIITAIIATNKNKTPEHCSGVLKLISLLAFSTSENFEIVASG